MRLNRTLLGLAAVLVVGGSGLTAVARLRKPPGAALDVPSLVVEKGPFTHTVSAEGVLKAAKSTLLLV